MKGDNLFEANNIDNQASALQDLAKIVEAQEGSEAYEHFLNIYSTDGYPVVSGYRDSIAEVRKKSESSDSTEETTPVAVMGRISSMRVHSLYAFFDIQDSAGDSIQVIIPRKKDQELEESEATEDFIKESKYGDVIAVYGAATKSRAGEPSVLTDGTPVRAAPAFISPDRIGPSVTAEERQERIKRYNIRNCMKTTIRRTLEEAGFSEVITPILSSVPSGANAEVFTSRIDALNRDAYLRISPELALKTAIINSYSDKVYEFATNFRNEGVDREHSPEFEMLEFYSAYTSAEELRDFTARMVTEAVRQSLPSTVINLEKEDGSSVTVDLSNWRKESYSELFSEATGINLDEALQMQEPDLKAYLLGYVRESFGADRANSYKDLSAASLIDKVFKLACRPHIQDPTFVEKYPAIMIPLARPNDENSNYVDMFQGIVGSTEVIKGYQELNDPVLQLSNLYNQAKAKAAGDNEAMSVDWSYLEAMLKGLPPTAGCGIGIDRLAAILNGTKNIHSTMPYPFRERFMGSAAVEKLMRSSND